MTDTTTARRQLLDLLLARVDRGVILPAERPLLRALITAEQAAADLPKQRHWRGTDGTDIANAYMDAQAALGRVRGYARTLTVDPHPSHDHVCPDDIRAGILAAIRGPVETPADAPSAPGDAPDVEIVHTNDIPTEWAHGTEPRCPAHYIGPPPVLADQRATADYVCELRVHPRGTDHAARLDDKLFCWTDAIAVYPLPARVPDDRRPCPTQFPDGACAGTWMHPGDCTTNADDIPAPHVHEHMCVDGKSRGYCRESCTACAGFDNVVPCTTGDAPSEPQP